jgi:hypothetical protein
MTTVEFTDPFITAYGVKLVRCFQIFDLYQFCETLGEADFAFIKN